MDLNRIAHDYQRARTRLIILDYDGTLVPFELHPRLTVPNTDVKLLVHSLAWDLRNHVVLVSGRDKEDLERTWNNVPIVLAAEHGGYYRNPGNVWHTLFAYSTEWIAKVVPALNALVFQYEGSFVEVKTCSIAWHYRAVANGLSVSERKQILRAINSLPGQECFLTSDDEYTIELRTPGIDKGAFIARWMSRREYEFIMAIGDGQTDEDMFAVLGKDAHTIKVGSPDNSAANYHIDTQEEVLPFIQHLLEMERTFSGR